MKVYKTKKAFDILELVKKNPKRYLSNNTISALQDFLNGYLAGNPYPNDEPPFWEFSSYLAQTTNFKLEGGEINLISKILLNECHGNEFESFDKFFEYLDKYKKTSIYNE